VTSYRPSIVTFPLSLRFSEILPLLCSSTSFCPIPPLISPKFPHVPLGVGGWSLGYEERRCGLCVHAISFQDFQPMSQTDRQTDGRTDGRHAISIPHRAVKSYHGEPIGSRKRSFERYHPRPPAASLPRLGVRNPTPKLQSLLSPERLKLGTSNLAGIFKGSMRRQAHEKFWRKGSVGVSRDYRNFFEYPLLSQERVKLQTSNLADVFRASMQIKPRNYLGEMGAWAYPGTAQFSGVPHIILGTGKATNFEFGRYIQRVLPNKSPLKIWEKKSVGVSRDSPNFSSTPIISVARKATNVKFGRYVHRVHPTKAL